MVEKITNVLKIDNQHGGETVLLESPAEDLSNIPNEYASELALHNWRLVRFRVMGQLPPKMVPDIILSLGKSAYHLNPTGWAQHLPGEIHDEVEAFGKTAVGPQLHMMRTGVYTDAGTAYETSFELCDVADIRNNSLATASSCTHEGQKNFSAYRMNRGKYLFAEETVNGILLPEELTAINGLYEALAGAGQELLSIPQPA